TCFEWIGFLFGRGVVAVERALGITATDEFDLHAVAGDEIGAARHLMDGDAEQDGGRSVEQERCGPSASPDGSRFGMAGNSGAGNCGWCGSRRGVDHRSPTCLRTDAPPCGVPPTNRPTGARGGPARF